VRPAGRRAAAAGLVLALGGARAAGAGEGAGGAFAEWARDDGLVRARIAYCGAAICATNTWVNDTGGDEKVGDKLIMTLARVDPTHWTGTAFDPKRRRDYSMEMSVAGDRLTTRGCLFAGIVCKGVGWSRFAR
jgi:uncharacterized protein (DUF2147 family)